MAAREFRLPDLGEGLEDAEIASWKVSEGDRVELNQTLVEVNTAKALVEIPSPWEGVVEKLFASEGDVVKVGEPLVAISVDAGAGRAPGDAEHATTPQEAAHEAQQAAQEVGRPAAERAVEEAEQAAESQRPKRRPVLVGYGVAEEDDASAGGGRVGRASRRAGPVPASPPVRRLAKELGVDVATIPGTGPDGRVTREDVTRASDGHDAAPAGSTDEDRQEDVRVAVKGTRRMIAEKMARSAREIPHVTTFVTVDAFWLEEFRAELERDSGEKARPLPIVVRALVDVCEEHPKLNASFDDAASEIVLHSPRHVGIATDTEHGLLVPVVRNAERRGIGDLAREIARLSEAARARRAKPEDLVGSTVTVTNVGTFGAEFGTPIINHPEAAILALGVIEPRALVVDGKVEARPAVTLSLSFDHRVMDGAEAGRALKALAELLESPFKLGALPR